MGYNIKLEVFEGPFDLLVYLIEKAQMDIYDIRITEITTQYIDYIEMMQKLNLDIISEFLVLAATLIEIKSKMLLPRAENTYLLNNDEDQLDPRSELVQKIIEYKKFKNAADILKNNEESNSKIYYKVQEDLDYYVDNAQDREYIDVDIDQFIQAFNLFLKKRKKIQDIKKKYTEIERERISIEDKIFQIKNYFKNNKKINFYNLISYTCDKYEIVVTFMAMLELLKQRFIKVQQHTLFGDIIIIKGGESHG